MIPYVFRNGTEEVDPGTRLFPQDDMYYYKTRTEQDRCLSKEEVESDVEKYRPVTMMEFLKFTNQINL